MNTILLRIIAPMQSWGVQSNFTVRDSGLEPSKSGVIGLLCAALGRPREARLEDLAGLRMGVRVDRAGTLRRDYQIAQDVLSAKGKGTKSGITSNRYYLADAAFLVGLESADLGRLEELQHALQHPVWGLFLGRKAFPPSQPVWLKDGIRAGEGLEEAFQKYPRLGVARHGAPEEKLLFIVEDASGSQVRPDVPISFAERLFSSRRISTLMNKVTMEMLTEGAA